MRASETTHEGTGRQGGGGGQVRGNGERVGLAHATVLKIKCIDYKPVPDTCSRPRPNKGVEYWCAKSDGEEEKSSCRHCVRWPSTAKPHRGYRYSESKHPRKNTTTNYTQ